MFCEIIQTLIKNFQHSEKSGQNLKKFKNQ